MSPQTRSRTRSVHEAIGPACQITVSKDGRMVAFATVTTTDQDELFANVHIDRDTSRSRRGRPWWMPSCRSPAPTTPGA